MGALTPYGRDIALQSMFGSNHSDMWADPIYVGISSTDPTTTVTEPTDTAYARVAVANDDTEWSQPEGHTKTNLNDLLFPAAVNDWGTLAYVFLADGPTGTASLYASDTLTTPQTILAGDILQIPVGGLVVSV